PPPPNPLSLHDALPISLDEKILRQEPLARAVRPHNADIEGAALDLGEGDQIAARRPYRRAVFALAKADAAPLAAAGIHHVELLRDRKSTRLNSSHRTIS